MIELVVGGLLFLVALAAVYGAFGRFEVDRMGGHCRAAALRAMNKGRAE